MEASQVPALVCIVLAAGRGKRMQSTTPKVLHKIGQKPMLYHVVDRLGAAGFGQVLVILGRDTAAFAEFMTAYPKVGICIQGEPRGTGDAVASAAAGIVGVTAPPFAHGWLERGQPMQADEVLVVMGDCPGLDAGVLQAFVRRAREDGADISVLAADLPDPTGYGRLIIHQNQIVRIVEDKDASPSERTITTVNTGIIYGQRAKLFALLNGLSSANAQGEYLLTDTIAAGVQSGMVVTAFRTDRWQSFLGVNTQGQLGDAAAQMGLGPSVGG